MSEENPAGERIPRDPEDDYSVTAATGRREFLRGRAGAGLDHVGSYSFDPAILPGNVENFIGVAQVPIGIACPPTICSAGTSDAATTPA